MTDITSVLTAIVSLAVAVLTVFVIPWLQTRISANEMDQMLKWVDVAVMAAQQLYHTADGPTRLEYAMDLLESKGYNIDQQEIRDAVEAAVLKLHQQLEVAHG